MGKCTWAINHQVCAVSWKHATGHDYALRSGRVGFDSGYVWSLLYSLVVTDSTVVLNERILTEMVVNKWLSKNKVSECLSRMLAARTEGALLSAEVKLGKERHIQFPVSRVTNALLLLLMESHRPLWWYKIHTALTCCHEDSSETFSIEASSVLDGIQAWSIPLYLPDKALPKHLASLYPSAAYAN